MSDRKILRKTAAVIMGFVMLFAVLFSVFYIAKEACHHCDGDECPICTCIEQCEAVLYQAGFGVLKVMAVSAAFVLILLSALVFSFVSLKETLVSRKVRLNN